MEQATLQLTGIVKATGRAKDRSVTGFRVDAAVIRSIPLAADDETIDLRATGSGVVDTDGEFRLSIGGEGEPISPIAITVSTPEGIQVRRLELPLDQVGHPIAIRVEGLVPLEIVPSEDPTQGSRITLVGRVIDEKGSTVASGLPVVLWGVMADDGSENPAAHPVVVTQTQSGGYFSANWVAVTLAEAFGRVAGSEPIPIALDDAKRLPRRVLLVLDVPETETDDAGSRVPAVTPTSADLTGNPAEFSQDLGDGCVDLTTPNRTVEEFIYTMVVRTSEPDVKGVTLGARTLVPAGVLAGLLEASTLHEAFTTGEMRIWAG